MGLKDLLAALVVLGSVLAAISHAVIRSVYLGFYRPFGITPEEVGLGRSEILLQTLAGPVVIVVVTALYLLGIVLLGLLLVGLAAFLAGAYFRWLRFRVNHDERHRAEQQEEPREVVSGRAGARERRLKSFYDASGFDTDTVSSHEGPNPIGVCLRRSFHGTVSALRSGWRWLAERHYMRVGFATVVVLLLTTVSAVFTGTVLARQAEEAARAVIRDAEPVYVVEVPLLPVGSITLRSLPVLQLRAIPARVSAPDGTPVVLDHDTGGMLYLGSDGEYLLVYVPDERRTVRLPVGEVSLDLETEPDPPFEVELAGEHVIDPETGEAEAGDADATASAAVTLSPFRERACYELEHELEPGPIGLTLHAGSAEVVGETVVALFPAEDLVGSALPVDRPALSSAPADGCVDIAPELAAELLRRPERFYVQVATPAFPDGALRGQLAEP